MSKPVKRHYIGGRFTDDEVDQVEQYIEEARTDKSNLVRDAIKEYIVNHPILIQDVKPVQEVTQP